MNDVNGKQQAVTGRYFIHKPLDLLHEQTPAIYGRSIRILSSVLNPNLHYLDCQKENYTY